jgi:hypothetical protein
MAESEPKPKLIELVGPGAGQGWKAVLKNGKAVVVHEIPVPPAEAAAAVPRIQRLFEHRHAALSPVLAWGTDPNGIWVAVEPNEGTPLATILNRGPLTPPAAAALGAAVLSGIAALHEAGIAMGGFNANAIRVNGNGEVRIAGHPAAAVRGAPSQSDLRADVRSCGMAVCAAFGVDPAGAPAPANVPPGLVVTMRSMASGAMGPAADRAMGALREMASALLAPDRQMAAQSELATRAGGREVPSAAAFIPQEQPAAPAAPAPAPQAPVQAPTPYVPTLPRDETPIRQPASYEAPDRPIKTYGGLPAIPVPTPSPPPPGPAAPRPSPPAVPTWEEASPRSSAPFEAPAAARATNPPDPAAPSAQTPPAPVSPKETFPPEPARESYPPTPARETFPPEPARESYPPTPARESFPPAPARDSFPPAPARESYPPVAARETFPPASAPAEPVAPSTARPPFESQAPSTPARATNPPAPAPVQPPAPAPAPRPAARAEQSWSPVEPPAWKPGEVIAGDAAAFVPPGMETITTSTTPPAPASSRAPTPAPAVPARDRTPAPIHRPVAPRRPIGDVPSGRPPWLVPAAVAVVVILLIGIIFVFVSRRGGSPGTASTSPGAHASGSPKSSPKPSSNPSPSAKTPQAVPNFGPASADPITKVIICSTATPCAINGSPSEEATACDLSSCRLEVGIYFSKGQNVPVSYIVKLFDRCAGTTTDLPGPNPYTPPGYAIVIPSDKWPVAIPSGMKSAALVAVAQQPAVAASAPLLLGSDTSCA